MIILSHLKLSRSLSTSHAINSAAKSCAKERWTTCSIQSLLVTKPGPVAFCAWMHTSAGLKNMGISQTSRWSGWNRQFRELTYMTHQDTGMIPKTFEQRSLPVAYSTHLYPSLPCRLLHQFLMHIYETENMWSHIVALRWPHCHATVQTGWCPESWSCVF